MNKKIRTGMIATALFGGSVFGVAQVAGTANAQVDDTPADTAQTVDAPADAPGRRGPHGDRGARAESTAALIGIDVEDLRAALEEGQTLAQIADANGVDPQTIIDAKVAAKSERLALAVEEGRLTADEAAEKLADATEQITTAVNEGRPERGERPDRGDRPVRGERPAADDAGASAGDEG